MVLQDLDYLAGLVALVLKILVVHENLGDQYHLNNRKYQPGLVGRLRLEDQLYLQFLEGRWILEVQYSQKNHYYLQALEARLNLLTPYLGGL